MINNQSSNLKEIEGYLGIGGPIQLTGEKENDKPKGGLVDRLTSMISRGNNVKEQVVRERQQQALDALEAGVQVSLLAGAESFDSDEWDEEDEPDTWRRPHSTPTSGRALERTPTS